MRKWICSLLLVLSMVHVAWANENTDKGIELLNKGESIEAIALLEKAAEEDDGYAAFVLGEIYRGVGGNQQDATKMVIWYQKAHDMGNPVGTASLADAYRRGEGGLQRDYAKGYSLLKSVENVDNDTVAEIAAIFYSVGAGTPVDYPKARSFANKIQDEGMKQNRLEAINRMEAKASSVPAKNLVLEVEQNQMRFDKNYKGKSIITEGFVDDIEEEKGGYVLKVFGEQGNLRNPFKFIACHFAADHEDALLALNKGDTVKVKGTYKGKQQFQIGAIVLFECEIVK
jgi:hypothetical protein